LTKGQIRGFLTQDTLYRLRQAVATHQKAAAANAGDRLALILGLCDTYLKDHGADTDARAKAKLASVEDIKAEAVMERNKLKAEARSLNDADAVAGPNTKPTAPPVTIKSNDSVGTAILHSQAPAKGEGTPRTGKLDSLRRLRN
jgi:hypothetical protein